MNVKNLFCIALVMSLVQFSANKESRADVVCVGIPFLVDISIIGDNDHAWLTYTDVFGINGHVDLPMNPFYDLICVKNQTDVPVHFNTNSGDSMTIDPGQVAKIPYELGLILANFTQYAGSPGDFLEVQLSSSDGTMVYHVLPPTSDSNGMFTATMFSPSGEATNLISLATDGELDFAEFDANDALFEVSLSEETLVGDVNLDGAVNLLDVAHFIDRLSTNTFQAEADINMDGSVNLLDVEPFVERLSGS